MNHSFNVEIATRLNSVEKAVLIENIAFWILKNKTNEKNYFKKHYWTYNSANAFAELFPYLKAIKIWKLLKSLENDNILKSGNFNKIAYDRTKWYTIIDKSIIEIYKIHLSKKENGITQKERPIPYIKTDIKKDIKKKEKGRCQKDDSLHSFKTWWDKYNKKTGKEKALNKWGRLKQKDQLKCLEVVEKYVRITPDKKFRKNPTTYLNGSHWQDEIEIPKEIMTEQEAIDSFLDNHTLPGVDS